MKLLRIAVNGKFFNQTCAPKDSAVDDTGPWPSGFVKTQTQPTYRLVTNELKVKLQSYYMIHPPPTQTVPIGMIIPLMHEPPYHPKGYK
jgi:hypothetical protein